ncbi:MAG: hypothetical protein O7F74_12475 [Bacteroidetes bacterium]|nr:hypothetical protein [Bacteroidota bacterium]
MKRILSRTLWATYMRPIFLFVLTLSFGFQAKAQLVDDFEVINVLLAEFEKKELLPRDIYPLIPPPPESREKFIKLRDDLTPEDADSLFSRIERSYLYHSNDWGIPLPLLIKYLEEFPVANYSLKLVPVHQEHTPIASLPLPSILAI